MYVIIKNVKNKKTGKSLPVILLNTDIELNSNFFEKFDEKKYDILNKKSSCEDRLF